LISEDDATRKAIPVYDGFIRYFPRAMAEVALHSKESNEQHNPGEPMYWNRQKSMDQKNSAARHVLDRAIQENADPLLMDSARVMIKIQRAIAWRELAQLEIMLEEEHENT